VLAVHITRASSTLRIASLVRIGRVSVVRPAAVLVRLVDPHRCHPMSRPNLRHLTKTTARPSTRFTQSGTMEGTMELIVVVSPDHATPQPSCAQRLRAVYVTWLQVPESSEHRTVIVSVLLACTRMFSRAGARLVGASSAV
jgi:hypothetical protein